MHLKDVSESSSKAVVVRCICTNIMNEARLNISHGDKNSSKKALGMVRSKASQKTTTPGGIGVSKDELVTM